MSYFIAATRGLNVATGFLKQAKRLFRDAGATWIVLTDWGYELRILGELVSMSSSLEEALDELDTALLHGPAKGFPAEVPTIEVSEGVWGVDMAELTRRARQALESL